MYRNIYVFNFQNILCRKNLCFYYVKYKTEYLYQTKRIAIKNRNGNMIVTKKRKK